MSLRHRVLTVLGALTIGPAALAAVPGFTTAAFADGCATSVTTTAQVATSFDLIGRPGARQQALDFLTATDLPTGGWTASGTAGTVDLGATAAATEALLAAGSTDPGIGAAREVLLAAQDGTGALAGSRSLTAAALPALFGTEAAESAADWLEEQMVDGGDDNPDHFQTDDGAYDFRLTADAVVGWSATGTGGDGLGSAAAWLGRHAAEYLEEEPGVDTLARLILVARYSDQSPSDFGPDDLDLVAELTELLGDDGRFSDDIGTHALAVRALGSVDGGLVSAAAATALDGRACTGGGFPVTFAETTVTVPPTSPSPSGTSELPTAPTGSTTSGTPTTDTPAPTSGTGTADAPTQERIVLDTDSIKAGDTVSFGFSGFQPFERIRIELHSTPIVLGYVQADDRGAGRATVTIPLSTPPGQHQIWLIGEQSDLSFSRTVTIEPAAPTVREVQVAGTTRATTAPTRTLSATGTSSATVPAAIVGGLLLLAGTGLALGSRRRSTR